MAKATLSAPDHGRQSPTHREPPFPADIERRMAVGHLDALLVEPALGASGSPIRQEIRTLVDLAADLPRSRR